MFGLDPLLLVDTLPWWIAMPLLQIGLLVLGMALDETYVNRTTVLAGALALYVHSLVTDGLWLPVALYMDVGLVVGAYGLYAYVVDGYVGNWFRVLAYFAFSPLAIFLIIVLPDLIFFVGLGIAVYANLQLLDYFRPAEPYYFGPDTNAEFEEILRQEDGDGDGDSGEADATDGASVSGAGAGPGAPTRSPAAGGTNPSTDGGQGAAATAGAGAEGYDPAAAQSQPSGSGTVQGSGGGNVVDATTGAGDDPDPEGGPADRGILPEFMRRL